MIKKRLEPFYTLFTATRSQLRRSIPNLLSKDGPTLFTATPKELAQYRPIPNSGGGAAGGTAKRRQDAFYTMFTATPRQLRRSLRHLLSKDGPTLFTATPEQLAEYRPVKTRLPRTRRRRA